MSGFAHGQTIEQFSVKGKNRTANYFLLGGKTDEGWSTELACIDYGTIVKYKIKGKKGANKFSYNDNLSRFKQIKDLEYANLDRKKKGKLDRADGALSADGKNLVVWVKLSGNKVQVSVYDFTKIKEYLYGTSKGKKAHRTFSFKDNGALAQSACYTSYIKDADKEDALKPSGSFQSIEISNTITDKGKKAWHIYICGGNTGENPSKPLRIVRFLMRRKERKIAGKKPIGINPLSPAGKDVSKHGWEIEGCHISGGDLEFGITSSKKGKKGTQYIHFIKKDVF